MSSIYLIDSDTNCFWCEEPLPCGCEHYLEDQAELEAKKPKPFPVPYIPEFLTRDEADEIFNHFCGFNACHLRNPYNGSQINTKSVSYAADLSNSQVSGGYHDPTKPEPAGLVAEREDDHCHGPKLHSSESPDCIKKLQIKLNAHLHTMRGYEKHQINYISVMIYPDENSGIAWHRHGEDAGCDTPTLIVSTGAVRDFYLGEINKTKPKQPLNWWRQPAEHGSLIVLPAAMNDTHWHAILKNERSNRRYDVPDCSYGPRISINTKCLRSPRIFSIKEKHPRWAVYVGRAYGQYPDTPYGNYIRTNNEQTFREYAEKKMLDPAFREQAIKDLRGKHLICWCSQHGLNRAPFCHARVWCDLINRKEVQND